MTTKLAPRTHPMGRQRKRAIMTRDEALAVSEKAVMALAEVGIHVQAHAQPSSMNPGSWVPSLIGGSLTPEQQIMCRKAWAVVALSGTHQTMACIRHGRGAATAGCLGVYITDVIKDPAIECGAP